MKYFAKKPANGGIPASESNETVKVIAANGLFLYSPLKFSRAAPPVLFSIPCRMLKAISDAIE
jgi:hypothetical protein